MRTVYAVSGKHSCYRAGWRTGNGFWRFFVSFFQECWRAQHAPGRVFCKRIKVSASGGDWTSDGLSATTKAKSVTMI
jgi:hypothetical protein